MSHLRRKSHLIIALLLAGGDALAGADAVRGQTLYRARCAACHSIDYNGVGPAHRGVLGRKAGAVPDYAYSDALRHSDVVWTAAALDKWLADPEQFIPGQKMGFSVPSPKERADLIAYLKQAAGPGASPNASP